MDILMIFLMIFLFVWGFVGVITVASRSSSPELKDFNWKQKIVLILVGGPFCWILCPLCIAVDLVASFFKKCGILDKILEKLD